MGTRIVAVTGAAGFIGRVVTRKLLERGDYVYAVDALLAPADATLPSEWERVFGDHVKFVPSDINALERLPQLDAVINLAAETHVCNSLTSSERFLRTNVLGVAHLLDLCRDAKQYGAPRFIQISTDEVYGDVSMGASRESDMLRPSSPYAATKAAADQLVAAWGHTHGIRWNIVRPSNCYGLGQYPEKLIPRAIRALTFGRPITVHGNGQQRRCWLNVEDCADAILTVLDRGQPNDVYNIGGEEESVRAIANLISTYWQSIPSPRPTDDQRYCVDDAKLRDLGWARKHTLTDSIPRIVEIERARFRW